MLKRANRFSGLGSVRPAQKYGKRYRVDGAAISVLYTKKAQPRYAVIVSKKVSKKAVVRNRIRRRCFEFIRLNDQLLRDRGLDVVITVYDKNYELLAWPKLVSQLSSLCTKADLYS